MPRNVSIAFIEFSISVKNSLYSPASAVFGSGCGKIDRKWGKFVSHPGPFRKTEVDKDLPIFNRPTLYPISLQIFFLANCLFLKWIFFVGQLGGTHPMGPLRGEFAFRPVLSRSMHYVGKGTLWRSVCVGGIGSRGPSHLHCPSSSFPSSKPKKSSPPPRLFI